MLISNRLAIIIFNFLYDILKKTYNNYCIPKILVDNYYYSKVLADLIYFSKNMHYWFVIFFQFINSRIVKKVFKNEIYLI